MVSKFKMGLPKPDARSRLKMQDALLVLMAAAAVMAMLIKAPSGSFHLASDTLIWDIAVVSFICSPAALLLGAVLFRIKPRFAYLTSMFASVMGLPWLAWTESRNFQTLNSWIAMNLPHDFPGVVQYLLWIKLKIFASTLLMMIFSCALIRLIPSSWIVKEKPISQRTWPVLMFTLACVAAWYSLSVHPYRVPIIVDVVLPEIRILHVKKKGVHFEESSVTVYHGSRFFSFETRRRLFQYRFIDVVREGRIPDDLLKESVSLQAVLPRDRELIKPLRSWAGEGWYVITNQVIHAYTTENSKSPPPEIMKLFRELEDTDASPYGEFETRDICFGFCYDPLAAMGVKYVNQRCFESSDHKMMCR